MEDWVCPHPGVGVTTLSSSHSCLYVSVLHSQALLGALQGPVTMGTYACFLALSNTGFHFLCTWQSQRALKYAVFLLADWYYKLLHRTVNSLSEQPSCVHVHHSCLWDTVSEVMKHCISSVISLVVEVRACTWLFAALLLLPLDTELCESLPLYVAGITVCTLWMVP